MFRLCPVQKLDYLLLNHAVSDILECLPQPPMKRTLERLFDNLIPDQVLRELDHINLSIGEETVGLQTEEHQPHILRFGVLRQGIHNVYAPAQIKEIHALGFFIQGTLHLFEVRLDQRKVQINDIRLVVDPVVKRDIVGQIVEIPFFLLGGHNGAGHFPDIANTLLLLFGHRLGGGVGAQIPARRPDHNEFLVLIVHHFNDGQIFWLDTLALVKHILQITVYFVCWNAFQRVNRPAVLFLNADHEVTAAPVVNIVGKDYFTLCKVVLFLYDPLLSSLSISPIQIRKFYTLYDEDRLCQKSSLMT